MEFQKFNKIPRLNRECVITEKIDGSNAQIAIVENKDICKDNCIYETDEHLIFAGSRNRWLDTSSKGDNFGFAKWVQSNAEELLKLGEGRHYGEWYGQGIQRGYGLDHKRFTLFNVKKWSDPEVRPKCCDVVPVLYDGIFDMNEINLQLSILEENGSFLVSGYMKPEGIVVFRTHASQLFKVTIENDEKPKGKCK